MRVQAYHLTEGTDLTSLTREELFDYAERLTEKADSDTALDPLTALAIVRTLVEIVRLLKKGGS